MRSHRAIIKDADGATALADKLLPHMPEGRWETVKDLANTVQGWVRADSIPPEYWPVLVGLKLATHEELAHAVATRKIPGWRAPASTPEAMAS